MKSSAVYRGGGGIDVPRGDEPEKMFQRGGVEVRQVVKGRDGPRASYLLVVHAVGHEDAE